MFVALTIVVPRGPSSSTTGHHLDEDPRAPVSKWAHPPPDIAESGTEVDHAGGSVRFDGAEIVVPVGAIGEDGTVTVSEAVRADPSPMATERTGPVDHADHAGVDLEAPIEVWWDLSSRDDVEAATAVPVRWDPDVPQWRPVDDRRATIVHDDGRPLVSTTEFSFLTWISDTAANPRQTLGEILGSRRDAPECSADE